MKLCCAVVAFLLLACSSAQDKGEQALVSRYRPPAVTTENAPLLVLLHGYGSNEDDLFSLAGRFPYNIHIYSVRGPYQREGGGFAWFRFSIEKGQWKYDYSQAVISRKKLLRFISAAITRHKADSNKVIVLGFSQGAMMAFDLGLHASKKVHAVAALSGGILPQSRENIKSAGNPDEVSYFIGHGTADDLVPLSWSADAETYLRGTGAHLRFKRYACGHSIAQEELNDVVKWLREVLK